MKWLRGFWKSSDRPATAHASQSAESGPFVRAGPVRLSVGLDFGTHSTKVAYFQFGAGARVIRPLRFQHGLAHWPEFTLPAVGLIRNSRLVWGAEAAAELDRRPWNEGIRRLKVLLAGIGDPASAEDSAREEYSRELEREGVDQVVWRPEHVASAALAVQVAEVHRLLRSLYPGRQLDAQFTIAVPIDHVQNSTVLGLYHQVENTSQQLLSDDGTLRVSVEDLVSVAADEFPRAGRDERPDGRLYTLPEAVAQIASYLTSLEATAGVHGVVDIGAGTTDVSVFRLDRPERHVQECYWYSALAIPRASTFVHRAVAEMLPPETGSRLTEMDLVRECAARQDRAVEALERIRTMTKRAWASAYGHLKKETVWRGCPLFLCGGGALLPGADAVFRQCWVRQWPPHELRDLPTPSDYRGDGVPFRRMAVAYGLAIPKPEHGGFVLPKDAPDHTPPKRYKRYEGMGGDQPYPTPDWL